MTSKQIALSVCAFAIINCLNLGCVPAPKKGPTASSNGKFSAEKGRNLSLEETVQANNRFAFSLMKLLAEESENVIFSPISITSSLGMTSAGARGKTLAQIQTAFQWQGAPHSGFKGLLPEIRGSSDYQLHMANRLWGRIGAKFYPDLLTLLDDNYGAGLAPLDFVNQPNPSRLVINQWVEEQTHGKIQDLLPDGSITSQTDLVLTNAIYFFGHWLHAFKEDLTEDKDFHVRSDQVKKAPFMQQRAQFGYAEMDQFQVLQMPYQGEEVSFIAILPRSFTLPKDLVAKTTLADLEEGLTNMSRREVQVFLPRFKAETTAPLVEPLNQLGMLLAFDPHRADFSGFRRLTPGENLSISAIFHKAFVDVNEEGTEAAAATAVVMATESVDLRPPPPVFRADRPFIYFIQHRKTGLILFMGLMGTP